MIEDEMKVGISLALKDPVLQQGFEAICKNVAELEEQIETMKCPQNCKHGSIFVDRFFDDVGIECDIERTLCEINRSAFCEYCNNWEMKEDD